jgi:hypothetical protein
MSVMVASDDRDDDTAFRSGPWLNPEKPLNNPEQS